MVELKCPKCEGKLKLSCTYMGGSWERHDSDTVIATIFNEECACGFKAKRVQYNSGRSERVEIT